jgi:hypothetical protein
LDTEKETVVYSKGFETVPNSDTNLQKLYLLKLMNQITNNKGQKITFWSDKKNAELYVAGTYPKDGLEGWIGENSKFGVVNKENGKILVTHRLSNHEADQVTFGY